jgi:hypothetical protein
MGAALFVDFLFKYLEKRRIHKTSQISDAVQRFPWVIAMSACPVNVIPVGV